MNIENQATEMCCFRNNAELVFERRSEIRKEGSGIIQQTRLVDSGMTRVFRELPIVFVGAVIVVVSGFGLVLGFVYFGLVGWSI